jgi:MFS transporter, DHA2 family, methylenomycin A resistance protein
MTVIAMGLGYAIAGAGPTILSANRSQVRIGLHTSTSTASFIASLATLTMAAAVLGAGTLGDLFGMRRLFAIGLLGTIAFGLLAAAVPSAPVFMVARAGIGVALAFLLALSLAVTNAVFPPGRRARAIALYFGAGYVIATPLPALASHIGWRACFLVTPIIAVLTLAITLRYVPETPRATRALDVPGPVLVAVALLVLIYGISRLENGVDAGSIVAIVVGLVAGAGFVIRELRIPDPAVDLRIFRSGRLNAAVIAGVAFNFLVGGSMILFAFYLVTVRGHSPQVLGLLLIPATALGALAATAGGPAATRAGDHTVLVAGPTVMLGGLLLLRLFDEHTSLTVVFAAVALNLVGGALVATLQATIMMAGASDQLIGAVSGVKCAVNQAGYSLGPAVFALVGINLIISEGMHKLAGSGITIDEAREAFRATRGGLAGGSHVVDRERAKGVVAAATQSMLDAIHTLGLVMAAVPIAAIVRRDGVDQSGAKVITSTSRCAGSAGSTGRIGETPCKVRRSSTRSSAPGSSRVVVNSRRPPRSTARLSPPAALRRPTSSEVTRVTPSLCRPSGVGRPSRSADARTRNGCTLTLHSGMSSRACASRASSLSRWCSSGSAAKASVSGSKYRSLSM